MTQQLFEQTDAYISSLTAVEDEILRQVPVSMLAAGMPFIQVSANQGKLLQVLAKACNARNILEIGTLAGYSAIWMARALPPGGKLITLEYDAAYAEVARQNIDRASLANQVNIRVGKALDLLPQLEAEKAGPFDMVFIDADKMPYTEYFEWALKLSRPGTIIVADNVIRSGEVMDPENTDEKVQGARRFNEALAACTRVTATILQTVGAKTHDGIAVAVVNS
jgi:caffeoyl-CoA O-methyltransferase